MPRLLKCILHSIALFSLIAPSYAAEHINPTINIVTHHGTIVAELYDRQAPITVNNFLRYVDQGLYNDIAFYRTVRKDNQPINPVKIAVIQGGFSRIKDGTLIDLDEPWGNIAHETTTQTGLKHLDGTLSMARLEPGTANGHFAIMIGDQPELDYGGKRNPDGQGFAAFGRVIKGMDVVKKIHQLPAQAQLLTPPIQIMHIKRTPKTDHTASKLLK